MYLSTGALSLGSNAPDFRLSDTEGRFWSPADLIGENGLIVAFICNHCPFVLHLVDSFVEFARECEAKGVRVVAISSNDHIEYPEDAPEHMGPFARERRFSFPYLYDESQDVAKAYGAVCTPDFFIFNRNRALFYNGQYDSSRPKVNLPPDPDRPLMRTDLAVTGEDMRAAVAAMLAGQPAPEPQRPSVGCSIKWRSDELA